MHASVVNSHRSGFTSRADQKNERRHQTDKTTTHATKKALIEALSPTKLSRMNMWSPRRRPSPVDESTITRARVGPGLHHDHEGLALAVDPFAVARTRTGFGDMSSGQNGDECVENRGSDIDVDSSCFSTFSEIPNADMTLFAQLGASTSNNQPLTTARNPCETPRTPNTLRKRDSHNHGTSLSPSPRRHKEPASQQEEGYSTDLLLDFTGQSEPFSQQDYMSGQRSAASRSAARGTILAQSNPCNLLDLDFTPMPTPASLKIITMREMESVKSAYQSQISSLAASLNNRCAEVESLKTIVADAERRAGEATKQIQELTDSCATAEGEKNKWKSKLASVEEALHSSRREAATYKEECIKLQCQLNDSQQSARDAEIRAVEQEARALATESKMVNPSSILSAAVSSDDSPRYSVGEVRQLLDEKVVTLCRELHVIYKEKHENKVAALKRSFGAKSQKQHAKLSNTIKQLNDRIEELQCRAVQTSPPLDVDREADMERLRSALAKQTAAVEAVGTERALLLQKLDHERREKSELVAAVDEMLALQASEADTSLPPPPPPQQQQRVAQDLCDASATPGARPNHSTTHPNRQNTGIARPPGHGGFGFGGGGTAGDSKIAKGIGLSSLNRSVCDALPKSRFAPHIERTGVGSRRAG